MKRRNPNGFEPQHSSKHENKTLKVSRAPDSSEAASNELQHHNPIIIQTTSDVNTKKTSINSKTLTYGSSTQKNKAHSKRARNRSLEMVIDDDKADSSPSRSRYCYKT